MSSQNGMPITHQHPARGLVGPVMLRYYAGADPGRRRSRRCARRTRAAIAGARRAARRGRRDRAVELPASLDRLHQARAAPGRRAAPWSSSPARRRCSTPTCSPSASSEAGLPPGVVNILPGGREIGAYLVGHPGIDKVAFTGSTTAGRAIAETCAELLRPVSLELGGKSAAIVLDDADLDAQNWTSSSYATMVNNGQTCCLGTRILAAAAALRRVRRDLHRSVGAQTVGDALDPSTEIGPMTSSATATASRATSRPARDRAGQVTAGGGRPQSQARGLVRRADGLRRRRQQLASSRRRRSSGRCCRSSPTPTTTTRSRIANDSDYGLGGTVWTADHDAGVDVARRIHTGIVGINGYRPTRPLRSAGSRTAASAASWAPRAWRPTSPSRRCTPTPPGPGNPRDVGVTPRPPAPKELLVNEQLLTYRDV